MMMTSLTTITPFESPFQSRNPSTTNLNTISTNTSEISFINITPDEIINSINYCNDSDDGSIHKSKSNDLEIKLVEPIVFFRDVPEEAREVFSHNWKFITANKSPPTSSTSSLNSPSLNKFNFLKFNKKFHGDSSNDNNKLPYFGKETLLEDQEDGDVGNVTYQQIMDVNLPVCSEPLQAYAMVTMLGLENGHHLLNEPWIPILLIFSRARIADPVMPLIPMFLVRMNHLRMTMPPNPSLTISFLPWIRIIYNWTYQYLFGRMELNWRRQIEPYTFSTQNENGEDDNNNNVQQQYDQDMSDRLDRNNAGRKIVGALFLPC
ncbi:7446_t:CDS:2 [Entrophospora sp. SA101]|nr:7446_t:CDS:2 [Entrophospora sp. SA101]